MPWSRRAAWIRRLVPDQVLDATRMVGVGIVSTLGQLVVDMPSGYFGASDRATSTGLVFSAAMLAASCGCAVARLVGVSLARALFGALVLVGAAFFLPALTTDVATAVAILGWQLAVGSQVLISATPAIGRRSPAGSRRRARVRVPQTDGARDVAVHILMLSGFATLLVVGFEATTLLAGQLICLALDAFALAAMIVVYRRLSPRQRRPLRGWALTTAFGVAIAMALWPSLTTLLAVLGTAQLALLAMAVARGPAIDDAIALLVERPALLLVTSFATLAGLGAIALTLPAAGEHGRIAALDALFTAMSAVCVTGLGVVDTPLAFSGFGEAVLLLLIQLGGLGIMVLSTFATVVLGGRLTLRGEQALGDALELGAPGQAYRLVRFIVISTLAIEAVGAVLLTIAYLRHDLAVSDAIWRGVFQSISAFCNAGFSLQSDSIMMFATDPFALAVHGVLIILGGLGFVVLAWLWARVTRGSRCERPSVQLRVVVWLSSGLVLGGAVLYAALEWNASLADLATVDKLVNALFQSVTTRTAGFNSIDFTELQPATVLMVMLLMFIGGAPGGTAGGIKVTTLAVLTAGIGGVVRTRGGAHLFGRSIPAATLQRAATIAVVSCAVAFVATFVLLVTEDLPFHLIAFEVVSALGTVGLSLGATGSLTDLGKIVIIGTMFLGRIGPLTLALALGRRAAAIDYPQTRMMVG